MYILYDLDKETILFQTENRIAMRAYLQLSEIDFRARLYYTLRKLENPDYKPKKPVLISTGRKDKKNSGVPGDLWNQWEAVRTSIILMGGDRLRSIRIVREKEEWEK